MSAALILSLLLLAMAGHSSALWCVCKTGLSDRVLQNTLDYACGTGADCNPTHPCFNPDSVMSQCNYAVNSYFQKKGQSPGTCDFSGTATPTNTDPSYSGCTFPTSASSGGSITVTPGTTNPKGSSTNTTTFPGGNSPYSGTSTNGGFGNSSTGATGTGINPDYY